MKKSRLKTTFLISLVFLSLGASAQENITIYGTVTSFGKIPLNRVEISVSKSDLISYTDTLGFFRISCAEKSTLNFYANGFERKKIKVKKSADLNIDLIYSNKETSFANATDNNHISEGLLSEALAKYPLKGEKDYGNYENIYQLIQNEIHTVRVSGTSVTTLKQTSFTSSQEVLYVVDGTIVSDVSFVLPFNVKSIRYVSGTGAAKYGSQGANGAIEITLK